MASRAGETPAHGTPGFWLWFFQRISGLLLLFLVLAHGSITHFLPIGDVRAGIQDEPVVYEVVKQRLAQGFFVFFDFALLSLALYHGLNGMRNIMLEWRPAARRQRIVTASLWILGLVSFGFGARALLVFIL